MIHILEHILEGYEKSNSKCASPNYHPDPVQLGKQHPTEADWKTKIVSSTKPLPETSYCLGCNRYGVLGSGTSIKKRIINYIVSSSTNNNNTILVICTALIMVLKSEYFRIRKIRSIQIPRLQSAYGVPFSSTPGDIFIGVGLKLESRGADRKEAYNVVSVNQRRDGIHF